MSNFLLSIFIIGNILWTIFLPLVLILENKFFVEVIESIFGKAPTNGILVRNILCVWLWPLTFIVAGPRILKWMKQPR